MANAAETAETTDDVTAESGYIFDPATMKPDDYVRVYRRDDQTKQWVMQFRLAPEEQTPDKVRELRGGGKFRAQHLSASEEAGGSLVIRKTKHFDLDGPSRPLVRDPWEERKVRSTIPIAGAATPAGPGGASARVTLDDVMTAGVLQLFSAMNETSKANMEAVRSIREQGGGGSDKTQEVLIELIRSQGEMFKALAERKSEPAVDPLAMLEKVTGALRDLMPPVGPGASLKDMIETLNEVMDLKERGKPEPAEAEDPVVMMVRDNLPKVLDTLQMMAKKPAGTLPAPTPTPKAPEALPASTTGAPASTQGESPMWQLFLAKRLPSILQWARRDKNPEVLASAEYELLPEDVKGPFRAFLAEQDEKGQFTVVGKIVGLAADLAPFANGTDGWLDRFVTQLQVEFGVIELDDDDLDDDEDGDPNNEGGDGTQSDGIRNITGGSDSRPQAGPDGHSRGR